jgi:hypothetical protein
LADLRGVLHAHRQAVLSLVEIDHRDARHFEQAFARSNHCLS